MDTLLWGLIGFAAIGAGTWLASFATEALKLAPKPPTKLRWAPNIPIQSVQVDGNTLRYVKTGKGPVLVFCIR